MQLLAKTLAGLEGILAGEIEELGGSDIRLMHRAVSFEGDMEVLYKVNLWSRTALRVLRPIHRFKAHNETVFYKRMRRYRWMDLIDIDQTYAINSVVNSAIFRHSHYMALKAKDAISDRFREAHDGQRPSIDTDQPDIAIDLHCRDKDFTVSLDSSGFSLHRRGYRQSGRVAPLNEVLAAGMIMLSGWSSDQVLFDPMCGSGTILIEAAMLACQKPPTRSQDYFAFMKWKDFDPSLWQRIRADAEHRSIKPKVKITGADIDARQIAETQQLVNYLGLSEYISIEKRDFLQSSKSTEKGVIIMNPPYDLRVKTDDVMAFYRSIGDTLKQEYSGWDAWLLSGNKSAIKNIGLRTSRKYTLYNGAIECKYHKYEMYKGKKTITKKAPSE